MRGVRAGRGGRDGGVCVCLLPVRAKAKIKGNKYGATRSALPEEGATRALGAYFLY